MDKEDIKKIAQEMFELMDFGEDTVVSVDRWNVIFDDTNWYGDNVGARAELDILVDELNQSEDIPSIPCVVTVLFDKDSWKVISANSENEYGDPNGVTDVLAYYAKKDAEKLSEELNSKDKEVTRKIKL